MNASTVLLLAGGVVIGYAAYNIWFKEPSKELVDEGLETEGPTTILTGLSSGHIGISDMIGENGNIKFNNNTPASQVLASIKKDEKTNLETQAIINANKAGTVRQDPPIPFSVANKTNVTALPNSVIPQVTARTL